MKASGTRGVEDRLIHLLGDAARERTVERACIGLGYMALVLDDGSAGLAYTFRREARGGCTLDMKLRPLAGQRASDILPMLVSDNLIEAGLGLACANALIGSPRTGVVEKDILEHVDVRPEDDVAMVGYFGPLVSVLRARARSLAVFERRDVEQEGVLPASEAVSRLPGCDVAIITATSIINHTIDDLLRSASSARQVVVLGASTPLIAEAFEGTPVTLLSGAIPRDTARILEVLSEAGGMQIFGRYVRKVNIEIRRGIRPAGG